MKTKVIIIATFGVLLLLLLATFLHLARPFWNDRPLPGEMYERVRFEPLFDRHVVYGPAAPIYCYLRYFTDTSVLEKGEDLPLTILMNRSDYEENAMRAEVTVRSGEKSMLVDTIESLDESVYEPFRWEGQRYSGKKTELVIPANWFSKRHGAIVFQIDVTFDEDSDSGTHPKCAVYYENLYYVKMAGHVLLFSNSAEYDRYRLGCVIWTCRELIRSLF